MQLYGSLTSPYVRKVRVVLAEKAIPCEFIIADAWAADSPVPALNPLGKVPALMCDDGTTLFDSPVIAEYIDSMAMPSLIPPVGNLRWSVRRWEALADGIMDAVVARLLESRRPLAQQSADYIARQEGKVARALAFAESQLGDSGFLVADQFSLADIALAVALEYIDLRYPHEWRHHQARLSHWLAMTASRPSLVSTQPPR
jgi:glutathione S-transferase